MESEVVQLVPGFGAWKACLRDTGGMTDSSGLAHVLEAGPKSPNQRYKNPPVIEAFVFIRVAPATAPIAALEGVIPEVPIRYPNRQSVSTSAFTIDLQNPKDASTTAQQIGYRYASEDNTKVVQVRTDGFVFSRLAPYPADGWDEWTPEARQLWARYNAVVRPKSVTLLQVRYANRIPVPTVPWRPMDYLTTYPWIGPGLPVMAQYILRAEFPISKIPGARLAVNQGTLYDPTSPPGASILLDLEVSKSVELKPDDPEVWDTIEVLHRCETEAFEACITDTTRAMFNQ